MAVAFIAGNGAGNQLVSTLDTGTFTIGSQTDKALIVGISWSAPSQVVTAVAWDPAGVNQALTSVAAFAISGNRRVQFWRLINPTAVTGGIVRATWGGATIGSQAVYAAAFSGVHQTTPADNFTLALGTSDTPSVTVPSVTADDDVMDVWICDFGSTAGVGANQTPIGAGVTPGDGHWASYQSGADGGVMSWTTDAPGSWITGAVRIAAAAGAPSGPTLPWLPHSTNVSGPTGARMIPSGMRPPQKP